MIPTVLLCVMCVSERERERETETEREREGLIEAQNVKITT